MAQKNDRGEKELKTSILTSMGDSMIGKRSEEKRRKKRVSSKRRRQKEKKDGE